MTPERWQQIETIVDQVLDLPPHERVSYVATACGPDLTLRKEVEQMLDSMKRSETFLSSPAPGAKEALLDVPSGVHTKSVIGTRVGHYRIRKELGRGGMGSVYLAERDDDQFKKMAALKLIRRGMDTDEILQRFRNERQILAALDHPNIARILDGGMTDDGLPYFVMEYIQGVSIDKYCDQHKLGIKERLELFRTVCSAVQYAHQNLIVHRDLKPSNILVTEEGTVKLLDFGIAKVINPHMSSADVAITRTEVRLMTPEYASPEQVMGGAITTASDVYALGVILYELLTGHRPYQLKSRVQHEIERVILEAEPTRPSTAITRVARLATEDGTVAGTITPEEVSRYRNTQAERLKRNLRGDLDNIVMMALRKEPKRRYASVEQLSEDVRRHMDGMPVIARADTMGYRMQKFFERHRMGVVAAILIMLSLIGGLTLAIWQAQVASQERDRARVEAQKAEEVKDFMLGLFKVSDPSESLGETITAREILDQGSARISEELEGQPEVQAEMMQVVGEVYRSLGLYEKGEASTRTALNQRRELFGERSAEVAESIDHLASLLQDKGNYEEAEPLFRQALDIRQSLFGASHPDIAASLNNLGLLLRDQGKYDEAEGLFRQALIMRRDFLGIDHPDYAISLNSLGLLLRDQGKYEEAEPLYRETLDLRRRLYGQEHPQVATALNNLASLLYDQGKYDEAEPLFREALAMRRKIFGTHPDVANSLNNLANLYQATGNLAGAAQMLQEALDILAEVHGEDHQFVAITRNNLAGVYFRMEQYDEAEPLLWRVLDYFRRNLPAGHPNISSPLMGLGRIMLAKARPSDAEPLVREALEILQARLGEDHLATAQAKSVLGEALVGLRNFREAEPLLVAGYEKIREVRGLDDSGTQDALRRLIALYETTNDATKSAQYRALLTTTS